MFSRWSTVLLTSAIPFSFFLSPPPSSSSLTVLCAPCLNPSTLPSTPRHATVAKLAALLSPDDLLQGCKHLSASTADKSSHSGAAQWGLYTFPSGVIVLKSAALAEELLSATESLYALLDSCGGSVTELDVSRKYSVSLQLAAELLTLWEAGPRLLLCRDETMDGTRFHRNFFLTAFAY